MSDHTTIWCGTDHAERLKEIRDEQGHRSLDETVAMTIEAWDQLRSLEIPGK